MPLYHYKALNIRRPKSKSKLRVALFSQNPSVLGSGNERLVYNTAKSLIERGHDARVYVKNAHIRQWLPFFVHKLPKFPGEYFFEKIFSKITGINDFFFPSTLLMALHPWIGSADVLHFHNIHAHYVSIPFLGVVSRIKPVLLSPVDQYLSTGYCPYTLDCEKYLTGCGSCPKIDAAYPGISRDATKLLFRIKKAFIKYSRVHLLYHTEALANHYKQTFVQNKVGKVIPYGEDINCFQRKPRSQCRRRLGLSSDNRFVIGLFHSFILDPRKGILPIIKKLDRFAQEFADSIELLVVGRDSASVKAMVPTGISATVLPYLRHSHELSDALNICDVLLYPTQAENLSLLTLAALACGVPVISFDAGGQKEAIRNGVNGFIVARNDFEGMFDLIAKMIRNPALTKSLGTDARLAQENYDFDRYIDDLIAHYYDIIGVDDGGRIKPQEKKDERK